MESLTGRIVLWDRQKGYGYVESEGRRVFLHIRDFAEHHKSPAIGDTIVFTVGVDRKGRPCAKEARHRNDGGRLRLVHLVFLALLLVVPGLASWRLGQDTGLWFPPIWIVAASGLTYFLYCDDKQRARAGGWRAPEKILHFFELAGGWPGAFLAQRRIRHKCSKLGYQFLFWLIVATHQFVAVDFLLGWRLTRAGVETVRSSTAPRGTSR